MFAGSLTFQSPAPLCAEQISIFRGGASMWPPKWSNLRGTEMPPFTSKILLTAAVHLSFAFKVLSPPGWHRNADMWHYCSSFFHYHINMDELTRLDRSPTGSGGIGNFKNLICIFGVEKWKSSRMLGWVSEMSGGLGWLGEVHPKCVRWVPECQLPWPHSPLGPVWPPGVQWDANGKCSLEGGWMENRAPPHKRTCECQESGEDLRLDQVLPSVYIQVASEGMTWDAPARCLAEMPMTSTLCQQETLTKILLRANLCFRSQRQSNE